MASACTFYMCVRSLPIFAICTRCCSLTFDLLPVFFLFPLIIRLVETALFIDLVPSKPVLLLLRWIKEFLS